MAPFRPEERERIEEIIELSKPPMRKEDQKRIAQYLYERGWPMARIADALGVSQQGVSGYVGGEASHEPRFRSSSGANELEGPFPACLSRRIRRSRLRWSR
jgi:Putative ATPase subunit of terminase (gpP-like)